MAKIVDDESFGAWVLKCNPAVFDLAEFLSLGHTQVGSWTVKESYRTQIMRTGQPVVFWVSGSRDGDPIFRGVWGIGRLTSGAEYDDGMFIEDAEKSPWRDLYRATQAGLGVEVDIALMEDPLPADEFESVPVLASSEVVRAPQLSNPAYLDKTEFDALLALVGEWERREPEPPIRKIEVGELGAGFGSAEQNRKVELAAMRAVEEHFIAAGYSTEDVSARKLGWDITAIPPTVDEDLRYIEVKGVSGAKPSILLTRGEYNASDDSRWELAVVTNALESPTVNLYTSDEVYEVAEPMVYQVVLD